MGCGAWSAGSGGFRTWAVPEAEVLLPDTRPELENEIFSSTAGLIRLQAAVNEVVSFQLALRAEGGSASVWGVLVEDLRQGEQVIGADQILL